MKIINIRRKVNHHHHINKSKYYSTLLNNEFSQTYFGTKQNSANQWSLYKTKQTGGLIRWRRVLREYAKFRWPKTADTFYTHLTHRAADAVLVNRAVLAAQFVARPCSPSPVPSKTQKNRLSTTRQKRRLNRDAKLNESVSVSKEQRYPQHDLVSRASCEADVCPR